MLENNRRQIYGSEKNEAEAFDLHFVLPVEVFLALVFFHLLKEPLLLGLLVAAATGLFIVVLTIEA